MTKMQLYMILFVISTALGFMILYVVLPIDFMSEETPAAVTEVQVQVQVQEQDEAEDLVPEEAIEVRLSQSKLMRSYMNTSADPCEDFYEYACGNFKEVNPIPKDKWEYSSIARMADKLNAKVKEVLEEPIGGDDPPDAVDKAKIFYRSCMDEETIERRGAEPLLEFLEDLGGWPAMDENWNETNFDWIQLAVNLSFVENGVVLAYDVEKHVKTADHIIYLKQPILGMSNIDYYLKDEHANKLGAYTNLVENVLLLLGVNETIAQNASEEIVKFETRLAEAKNVPQQNKLKMLLLWNLKKVEEEYDEIDWGRYISGVQKTNITNDQIIGIDYGEDSWYYGKLSGILAEANLETLANYMIWRGVLFMLRTLSDDFQNAWNDFNEILTGQIDPEPKWKVCVDQINLNAGMAVSALFVRKYFDESDKEVANEVINSLKEAFEENLSDLDWLGEETKKHAIKKLRSMEASVGYPEFILSEDALNELYYEVNVYDGEYFENYLSIAKFKREETVNKLFESFDPDYWFEPPTKVNALYNVPANRIIILAGILQPPTFHRYFPQSLNYGHIGMFLGHEIIHGFDDYGRRVDFSGNMVKWWNKTEEIAFDLKKKCFEEQYGNLSTLDIPFDAGSTISENLADNGGLRLAYTAYIDWMEENSHPKSTVIETLPNLVLDGHQLFFLGFAQAFCTAIRPESIEANKYENHSPSKYRIIGSLMNFEKFSEAFQCPEGSAMNPSRKCRIWDLVENVLLLLGVNETMAQNASEEIVKFETLLAVAKNVPEQLKLNILFQWTLTNLENEYNQIEWGRYFSGVQETNFTRDQNIGLGYGEVVWYYGHLSGILAETNLETLANYMIWRGVLFMLPTLSDDFQNAWNDFNEILTGQIDPEPKWSVCVTQLNRNIGMAVSALFVKKYFDDSSKRVAHEVIDSLKEEFEENLSDLDWLGEETKKHAIKKLRSMEVSVGYPEFILSEEALNELHEEVNVDDSEYFENYISITKFKREQNLNKLFELFDPEYWSQPPTRVNAFYNVPANRIVVLAGILQPPSFHRYFPQSLNYGNIGMFLGHEIIHGFDDNGRNVDFSGNQINWWKKTEEVAFELKKKCFEEQYGNLSTIDIPFDVTSTISENLADNGGLRLAYMAYIDWVEENSHPKSTVIETLPDLELDEHQLFFLGFAQAFCAAIRPEAIETNKYGDHSPFKYRAIGSLMNFEKFSEAFQCSEGSAMNPSRKCRIW